MKPFKHEASGTFQDQTYTVWGLDVWGHGSNECEGDHEDCEGYMVNDRSRCGTVSLRVEGMRFNVGTEHEFVSFSPDTNEIKAALVAADYLVATAEIEMDGENEFMLEVNRASNGRPLLQLERVHPCGTEATCDGSCEPMCMWCNKQADIAAESRGW